MPNDTPIARVDDEEFDGDGEYSSEGSCGAGGCADDVASVGDEDAAGEFGDASGGEDEEPEVRKKLFARTSVS